MAVYENEILLEFKILMRLVAFHQIAINELFSIDFKTNQIEISQRLRF